MSIQQFHDSSDRLVDLIESYVTANVEQTGIISEDCQQTYIKNAATHLSTALNGTEGCHLSMPETDHNVAFVALSMSQVETLLKALNHVIFSHHALDVLTKPVMLEVEAVETIFANVQAN